LIEYVLKLPAWVVAIMAMAQQDAQAMPQPDKFRFIEDITMLEHDISILQFSAFESPRIAV
jgi:hypothetical protein